MKTEEHWHLDRRVPIALIATIIIQTSAIVWWSADISARVTNLEKHGALTYLYGERIIKVETQVTSIVDGINDIKIILREKK